MTPRSAAACAALVLWSLPVLVGAQGGERVITLERYPAASGRGTIVGQVTARETGAPLPFADLLIEPFGVAAFTGSQGRFTFTDVPVGQLRIRARRLGSMPATLAITVRAERTDTLRIALSSIALQLEKVQVSDAVCPNRSLGSVDSSVVTILQQVQLNAERARLLAREYPFEMVLERTVANEGYRPGAAIRRLAVDTILVDTLTASLDHDWAYAPGALVRPGEPTGTKKVGAPDRLVVPQLVDFGAPAFVAAHCFRFAGVAAPDGQRLLRVDFEPIKGLPEPDVRGSLYLDTLSFQIRRSTLEIERRSPLKPGDFWKTRVDTWFGEVAASLPLIERIAQRTTVRTAVKADAWPGHAASEVQRLIEVRFLENHPE